MLMTVPTELTPALMSKWGDEQSYTGLNRSDVGEYDDRTYAHLNHVADVYMLQEETGI